MPTSTLSDENSPYEKGSTVKAKAPSASDLINSKASISYWSSISADVNGMLGGFPQVSTIDLRGSHTFLKKLLRSPRSNASSSPDKKSQTLSINRALDAGAGIGRVTSGLLLRVAETVDVVEPIAQFTEKLRQQSEIDTTEVASSPTPEKPRGQIGTIHTLPLESFTPSPTITYNLMWNQWCLGHLPDAALVAYFRRCIPVLAPGGWIVVKENLSTNSASMDMYDEVDSSITRSDGSFKRIFKEAGLKVVKEELQRGFPRDLGLLPVKMWGLRPV
ncbi:MAG: hypothetical protein Q9227_000659 [Pyrenula ochraceoflavens]